MIPRMGIVMDNIEKRAKELVEYAFKLDNGLSVACVPWSFIWALSDALEEDVPDHTYYSLDEGL